MRRLVITIALGLALVVPTLRDAEASASQTADSLCGFEHRIPYRTRVLPTPPCDGDRVSLVVNACAECDHILSGWFDGAIHLEFQSRLACPRIVCQQESLVVSIGRLAAGTHRFLIDAKARVLVDPTDSTFCEVSQTDTLTFQVGTCTPPPPPPSGSLPFVTQVRIGPPGACPVCTSVVCPGDSFPVVVEGVFPAPCYDLLGMEVLPPRLWTPQPSPWIVRLLVAVPGPLADPCIGPPKPFRGAATLPGLPSGGYGLNIEEAWSTSADTSRIDTLYRAVFPFEVAARCSTVGPPTRAPLITTIEVGSPPCAGCRSDQTCPGDSIPVVIAGVFPDGCWEFQGVEVLPTDAGSILPAPPRLRVSLFRDDCLDRLCAPGEVPFAGSLRLPPLPGGAYTLAVEERQNVPCGLPPDTSFRHAVGFKVADRCSTTTPAGCFVTGWTRSSESCDAVVDHGLPGQVTLTTLSNTLPMAGLQGTLTFSGGGLGITELTPVGPATTWQVAWEPTPSGARFVMFSTDGTLIPETDPVFLPGEVLRATVAVTGDPIPAPMTTLVAAELRASDPHGVDIPECPIMAPAQPGARICFGGTSCDLNGDRATDVRDLVLMVHCISGIGTCPGIGSGGLDCDGSGQATLADVLCCANVALHGTMPGSAAGRSEPDVQVTLGAPVPTDAGLDLPLRIAAADRLGAARVALRFPSDRFDVAGVEVTSGSSAWLELHAVDASGLTVGLIRVGESVPPELRITVRLRSRNGQAPGGVVRLESGDFSGPDGAALEVGFTPVSLPLGGEGRLAVSPPQPSPFARETRFAIAIPRAEDVELTVHDLVGRRIATLFRGWLEAGTPVFRWKGTDDAGSPATDGVYFIHVRGAGGELTRKVALLRGE